MNRDEQQLGQYMKEGKKSEDSQCGLDDSRSSILPPLITMNSKLSCSHQ